jgi:hypothetical protein
MGIEKELFMHAGTQPRHENFVVYEEPGIEGKKIIKIFKS